jgi:hypothetical protein
MLSFNGFKLVAKGGEISNLDLIKDIAYMIKLADSIPINPDHLEYIFCI